MNLETYHPQTEGDLKVKVYWNLHKLCWSIQHKGKVIRHAKSVLLRDCSLTVSIKGRERVLKEKKKNVHAFAAGILLGYDVDCPRGFNTHVTYNPYRFGHFYNKLNGDAVHSAPVIYCGDRNLWAP